MEHWCNDIEMGTLTFWEDNMSQCHFLCQKM